MKTYRERYEICYDRYLNKQRLDQRPSQKRLADWFYTKLTGNEKLQVTGYSNENKIPKNKA